MTHAQFDDVFHSGFQQYRNMMDTNDPGLSAFKAAGEKMIIYHGIVGFLLSLRLYEIVRTKTSRPTRLFPSAALSNITMQSQHWTPMSKIFTDSLKFLGSSIAMVELQNNPPLLSTLS